jgi:hypothetical protein
MALNEKFYVVLKLAVEKHLHVEIYAVNYFHAVIILVPKHVMMDHVQVVYYYRKIVRHVLVEKQSWIINNEHHVLIQYDKTINIVFLKKRFCYLVTNL